MKILIVDDEPKIREALKRGFHPDVEVVEASDGLDAWMQIQDHHGAFDVILSDVDMPIMGGYELFEHLKENYPALARRLAFQTGTFKHLEMIQQTGRPVLRKPYLFDDVLNVVRNLAPAPHSGLYPLLRDGRGIAVA